MKKKPISSSVSPTNKILRLRLRFLSTSDLQAIVEGFVTLTKYEACGLGWKFLKEVFFSAGRVSESNRMCRTAGANQIPERVAGTRNQTVR